MKLDFDERRKLEFSKIADNKGKMPFVIIMLLRAVTFMEANDKKAFIAYVKSRHSN